MLFSGNALHLSPLTGQLFRHLLWAFHLLQSIPLFLLPFSSSLCYVTSSSSNMNMSSIVVSRRLATLYASFRDGLYFPFSRKPMVSLLTPTSSARSPWVRSCLALSSFILVFMRCSCLFHISFSQEVPLES